MMEFKQRKLEAAANKQRGVAQWMGAPRPLPQDPKPEGIKIPSNLMTLLSLSLSLSLFLCSQPSASQREHSEEQGRRGTVIADVSVQGMIACHTQEYLARLRAIREQNYKERKRIQQKLDNVGHREIPPKKKKVEAAPAQPGPPSQLDPEERRRKIAALKVELL